MCQVTAVMKQPEKNLQLTNGCWKFIVYSNQTILYMNEFNNRKKNFDTSKAHKVELPNRT